MATIRSCHYLIAIISSLIRIIVSVHFWYLRSFYANIVEFESIKSPNSNFASKCRFMPCFIYFKISNKISNCFEESTQFKLLYDAIRNESDFSIDRPWMKPILSLMKWPMTFLFCAMITIVVIRRFAVKNEPDIF